MISPPSQRLICWISAVIRCFIVPLGGRCQRKSSCVAHNDMIVIRGVLTVLSARAQDKKIQCSSSQCPRCTKNPLGVKVTLDSSFNSKRKCCCSHGEACSESFCYYPVALHTFQPNLKCEHSVARPVKNVIITGVLCILCFFQRAALHRASESLLDTMSKNKTISQTATEHFSFGKFNLVKRPSDTHKDNCDTVF